MHTVTPHLVCAGAADAIDFYREAFSATEVARLPGPDGKLMHAALQIGDSKIMLVDEMPEWGALGPKALKGSPVTIDLFVADVDAAVGKAVAAGAKVTMPWPACSGAIGTGRSRTRSAISGRLPPTPSTSAPKRCAEEMREAMSKMGTMSK